ncbi:MAG TPA: putative toxin-antitoxin system toxin component, PIN family [Verrucomicrobiae bacterium]|nr:putative toxin-antitoxin system toxin component, PIN family [Verrucomicrobiae bacterium]
MDRLVIDTNVLVGAAILAPSMPRRVVDSAIDRGALLFSESTMEELKKVPFRPKFDRYLSREGRAIFLAQLERVAEMVPAIQLVRECRDPNDDKFLEVALNGRADVIITGDEDLLRMNPWRGIKILAPADYLGGNR